MQETCSRTFIFVAESMLIGSCADRSWALQGLLVSGQLWAVGGSLDLSRALSHVWGLSWDNPTDKGVEEEREIEEGNSMLLEATA